MSIAEIGSGAGDIIPDICRAIGAAGRVFAIEPPSDQAARFRERLRDCGNVEVVEKPSHATQLPDASCDRVLMANMWAELEDGPATLREARRLLREDGRLILVEWHADAQHVHAPRTRVDFRDMVRLLENEVWDVHNHGELGPDCYFLEAGVSDESVQS